MKIRLLCLVVFLVLQSPAWAFSKRFSTNTETDSISVAEALRLLRERNMLLQMKDKELEMAVANQKQERLLENPELSISHNINNPVTNRYFETNYDGQTDIQFLQRIYIGGQRGERIRKAEAELRRTEHERDDVMRLLSRKLSSQMVQLFSLGQKVAVIDKEILSTDKILKAYETQSEKGNVAPVEVTRIRSQHMQLLQERNSLISEMIDLKQSLRLMLAEPRLACLPKIDYEGSVAALDNLTLDALYERLASRADMQADKHDIISAEHELKLQKANTLPEVRLTGEWDKNGNIGHNFFAMGISFSVPIFNYNQGGRKAAAALLDSKRMQYEWNRNKALSEISAVWSKLQTNRQIAEEAEKHLASENENLITEVERQYMSRNISLLELLDYYQMYKDTRYLVIDSRKEVLMSMIELDLEIE